MASEFIQEYVGTGAKRIRELLKQRILPFERGETKAVIIFIDEIDAIGGKRVGDNSGSSREYQQTLLQLMALMDGFNSMILLLLLLQLIVLNR